MSKQILVDYIPFEISRDMINESIKENNGFLNILKGKGSYSVVEG